MDKWYKASPGCSIQHAGEIIDADKKIFLPEDLAQLHNGTTEQLIESDEPVSLEEAGVKAEWVTLQEQKSTQTAFSSKTYKATAKNTTESAS